MIVITTPCGSIGSAVAQLLLRRGEAVRLIARDPGRLSPEARQRAEVVSGSHADPEVLDRALVGADALFLLVPPDFAADDVTEQYLGFARPAAAAVQTHAVPRVVAVSSLGRGYGRAAGQLSAAWAMDEVLETSGAAYRSIQPPFFMENLVRQRDLIRGQGIFALTAEAEAPHPMVAVSDVAACAAGLLADDSWNGQDGVVVRAPDDPTPLEMAAVMSEALQRDVSYRQVPVEDYRAQLLSRGASAAVADGMAEMARAQWDGVYPESSEGGTGTSFGTWCRTVLAPVVG